MALNHDNNLKVIISVNQSDPKKAYKNLTDKVSITGTFRSKDEMDVLRPVFTLAMSTMENKNVYWQNYNYCEIPDFGNRKYFMQLRTLSSGLIECTCSVDALSTYIGAMIDTPFEIARASKSVKAENLLYADDTRPTQANRYTEIHKLAKLDETTGNNYVLTVAGG